jgi:hypothetical protein
MKKTVIVHVKEDVVLVAFAEGRQEPEVAKKVAEQLTEKYGKKVKFLPRVPRPWSVIEVEISEE